VINFRRFSVFVSVMSMLTSVSVSVVQITSVFDFGISAIEPALMLHRQVSVHACF